MPQIRVTGFHIFSKGDMSVGIFDSNWTLNGETFFDDQQDLMAFKEELRDTFSLICDPPPAVMTFEEHQAMLDAEDKHYSIHPDNQ